ncbi:MAG: hypothetical protein D6698_05660, partial [Gammaproteobacteria bacterium]
LFTATALNAQLTIKATGTGKTTGEIANLEISNESALAQRFAMPEYFYIPSANGHQGYIVVNDALSDLIIQPGERLRLPLDNGFCTNIHRPPVPDGQDLPPFNTWITPGNAAPLPHPGDELLSGPGWVPAGKVLQGQVPTFPGTEIALPGRIDPDEKPSGAAPVLFEALRRITLTVDDLYATGEVPPTPFADQPQKERETLIQQTFWIYSSLLNPSDEDYTVDDFAAQTWRQYTEVVGDTVNIAPEVRREVESGIQNFWNSFEAVGKKAKVLKEVKGQNATSVPVETCPCGHCEVQQPVRILDARTGELITGNTVPTYIDRIRLEPPVVSSDCPETCSGMNSVSVEHEIRYRSGRTYQGHNSFPVEFGISGPGELHLNSRFRCRCDGQTCGEGEQTRTIQFTESNDCCDRIRNRTGGPLRFGFGNGTVTIDRYRMTLHLPPSPPQTFNFDFNLEAVFCNLGDDQIYGLLDRISEQRQTGDQIRESISVTDISLGHPVDSGDGRPHYILSFSKQVNGEEVLVSISLDEASCVFDVQVLYDGELHEWAGPPYLSPSQMQRLAEQMALSNESGYWQRALLLLSHFARVRNYGRQREYSRAMSTFLDVMHRCLERMLRETHGSEQRAALNELRMLIVRAKTRSGFSHLDELLDKMIEVVNRL